MANKDKICCSFCGKTSDQVRRLLSGPNGVYICDECIELCSEILEEELEPIRARRKEYEKDIPAVYEILKKGSEKARSVAAATLLDVKSAMKINYFDDVELIKEQSERFH